MNINSRIKKVLGSSTLAITARAKELRAEGCDVVNFAAGEPDFDTPEFIKKAAVKAIEEGFTKYTPSIGDVRLRKMICEKLAKDNGLEYKPSEVVVSCGAKHSLFSVIQVLADEGDEVLIPAPYWVSYPEMVKIAGATPKIIPTTIDSNLKITAEQLEESISSKTKILILTTPSNPSGVVYSKEELEAIAKVCVKNNIFVISDEIYEKLIYDTDEYVSIASLGKEIFDLTITVNGVSKAYAMTGWRIGYCAGQEEIMGYVKKLQDHSTSNPCSISQMAALAALNAKEADLIAMKDEFRTRRDLMMSCVDKIPSLSYIRPEGAFYLFCNVSKLGNASTVAKQILEEVKVAVVPGEGFGAPDYVRLSFATSQDRIREGISRIGEWISKSNL